MKQHIQCFLSKYIINDKLALESRILNLVLVFGFFAESIVIVTRIIEGGSSFTILAAAGMLIITAATFLICNRFNIHKAGMWVSSFLLFNVFFPVVFFTNGGSQSGMPGYFVLCLTLIFFLFRGIECLIMCLIHISVIVGLYLTDRYYPHLIIRFTGDFAVHADILRTILVAGLLSGLLIKFQIRIYETEKEKAEAASRTKAEFLAKVSHELRTPLNAIIGLGELELRKKMPEGTRNNMEKIHNSGLILLNIINDLLDISKIESGRFELVPCEYQTASFINDTAHLNLVRIGNKPVEFKMEIDEHLPVRMFGDELKVRQILNNLLSNAFKYTREGTVRLKIHAETPDGRPFRPQLHAGLRQGRNPHAAESPAAPAGRQVSANGEKFVLVCSVEDTGIGIRKENLERIFVIYEQVDARSNHHIEGTGLGLSICKSMIELMGGTIRAESEYGSGSIFTARIPQTAADPRPIGRDLAENLETLRFSTPERERRKTIRNPMPYGKVLIVDDVPINLDVARGMILPYGLQTDCVSSGKEAITLIREQKTIYDLIFMDHMMPEMDGIEAVKIIRGEIDSDYARTVPVIALTANAIIGNEQLFLENGFQDYLTKPIDTSKLDSLLKKWVRNREKEKSAEWSKVIEKIKQEDDFAADTTDTAGTAAAAETSPVAGIDFSEGSKRMRSFAVFTRILKVYAASMPTLLDKIRYFSAETLADYRVNIHGIKGSCYGISANETGRMAETLEKAAKDGDMEYIFAHNGNFILRMEKLIEDIDKYLEGRGDSSGH